MGNLKRSTCLMMVVVAAMVFIMMSSAVEAQSESASCAQDLIPCANYLNATNPPTSCCDPLKQTVENKLTCLCNLFYSPGLLQSFNINVTQALELSRRCGVTSDITKCNRSGSAPPPTTGSPPATPGGDKGAAGRVSLTGFSFLLLLGASMLFN